MNDIFIQENGNQRNDIKHNDSQHNDDRHNYIEQNGIKHNDVQNDDSQQNDSQTLSIITFRNLESDSYLFYLWCYILLIAVHVMMLNFIWWVILLNAILVIVILMNVVAPLHFFTLSIVLYIFIRKKLTPTPTLNFIFK